MTVSSTLNKHIYTGNSATTNFSYTFYVLNEDDITLYLTDTYTDVTTEITSNYTISPTGGSFPAVGGTIAYPTSGDPITSTNRFTILRSMDGLQPTSYPNNTSLKPKVVEKSLDRITMIAQQQQEELNRTLKYDVSDTETISNVSEFVTSIENNVATTTTNASSALASATAAADSETNAAASETNAADSASSALVSSISATADAASALASKNAAAASATAAFGASAPAWDVATTYNYPDVVAYLDGQTYRCIDSSVIGSIPPDSPNKWVPITITTDTIFYVDGDGYLVISNNPGYSLLFELDSEGFIVGKDI